MKKFLLVSAIAMSALLFSNSNYVQEAHDKGPEPDLSPIFVAHDKGPEPDWSPILVAYDKSPEPDWSPAQTEA